MTSDLARRMADAISAFADVAEFKRCRCSMIKGTPEFKEMVISAKRFHDENGEGLKPKREQGINRGRNDPFAWADRHTRLDPPVGLPTGREKRRG
jgi:hypothetical protein